ncbi:A24 family peptidase [Allorhodopirellula heiligendammensis]|uniref:Type IV leader peptidase family protein n=1 Tax=Allorhodopirellula heiligendammensis TaxID=2714739 RepID=A0A5C6BWW5_9BACT|nr:A24 family peptidase [Allorhodopirellula heiligendammensis]TWU15284.1 Type IV leader peptidase family protein [Allorhodopirellula heiligendammensis]|tara:strand:+ start:587 stop:1144 length:558 start_codon:yes stop_codon:yes gene_type:complete
MVALLQGIADNWAIWLVTVTLITAAVIDGLTMKVPNWLTFPFIVSGWLSCAYHDGLGGFGSSLLATLVSMMLLLPLRNVGGMGAGDVKLLAGIGAWCGLIVTLKAFVATAIVGGIMAASMIWLSGNWIRHYAQTLVILHEWKTVRQPTQLAALARQRKSTMLLLPYGIPMAVGTILYFGYADMLL